MGAAVNIGSIGCSIATGPRLPCPIYGTSSRAAGAHVAVGPGRWFQAFYFLSATKNLSKSDGL